MNRNQPFNELALLPPNHEIQTTAVLKKCVAAERALGKLKVSGKMSPHQSVLINSIPILEAKDSSEIENIFTTTDNLFKNLEINSEQIDPQTKEALRYRQALFEGFQSIKEKPLSLATASQVCSTIKSREISVRKNPGTMISDGDGNAIYTPPDDHQTLMTLLRNWENYLHQNSETETLIRFAVGHYQFEAIHPFPDGNGRTGRILNLLYLIDQGLLEIPVLYLSKHIIEFKMDYYQLLRQVTEKGDWEPWILYMIGAVEKTAEWTIAKIEGINESMQETTQKMRNDHPRIYSRELVEILYSKPYCRISNLVEAGIVKRQAASAYLKELSENGFLRQVTMGKEKVFINEAMMGLLKTV